MTIVPIIDSKTFEGADEGIALPARRTVVGATRLEIENLDRSDPPPPWSVGSVPRSNDFNDNLLSIEAAGAMPVISVRCRLEGFDPEEVPLLWRLQVLHVIARYGKVRTDENGNPHYAARVVRLTDEWTGSARRAEFRLFDRGDANVLYDNASDRVAGGHAVLTVAAKPPGAKDWLVDLVHLRLVGTQPTEKDVRNEVARIARGRDPNLVHILNAIFAHEAGFRQFEAKRSSRARYKGVVFDWPDDPPWYPVGAFDFGVGLSQFTHPSELTASIGWDWRDNMAAGANVLLAALKRGHRKGISWRDWALKGWKAYNGSAGYARDRLDSVDGRKLSSAAVPSGFDLAGFTKPLALVVAPKAPRWPVAASPAILEAAITETAEAAERLGDHLGRALRGRIPDEQTLNWVWPLVVAEIDGFDGHFRTRLFPGVDPHLTEELLTGMPAESRARALQRAHAIAGSAGSAGATRRSTLGSIARDTHGEWLTLAPMVRRNIDHGEAAWPEIRERIFAEFGSAGDPAAAIRRINAYYGLLVAARFPKKKFTTPVHPDLKTRLDRAASLLSAKGERASADQITSVGGFNIRPNVNAPAKLSLHSFGWAVDIDPAYNPNVKSSHLPDGLIADMTGIDLFGAESKRLRAPRPYEPTLRDVDVLKRASDLHVAAFKTVASLKQALATTLAKPKFGARLDGTGADKAYSLARDGAGPQLERLLEDAGAAPPRAAAGAALVRKAVALQFNSAKAGVKPSILGSAASVTRYGFMNMPSPVVAALIAAEGAGLFWLGSANGTKDFMHFELFAPDRPDLSRDP